MKKVLLTFAVLFSASSFAKEIPSPFWFSISERILTETHLLISPDAKDLTVKAIKKAKAAKVKSPLKCQDKTTDDLLKLPFITLTPSGFFLQD